MLIYSKKTNRVLAKIPQGQPYEDLYNEPLDYLILENYPRDFYNYMVVDGELVKMSELEINEINIYNRILSAEERYENEMLGKLIPSEDEIRKAEQTIELLELLQEVL